MTEQEVNMISKSFDIFKPQDELIEIRSMTGGKPKSGYFRDKNNALKWIAKFPADTFYFVMNSIVDDCYAREQNEKILQGKIITTSDNDVYNIDWILIDCDPSRASGVSATDEEKAKAKVKSFQVWKYLKQKGFAYPIVCDSGNGYHLLYNVSMKNEKDRVQLVKDFLKALDMMFSDDDVKIDTAVFNPSRITKLYGTVARKGSNTPERPHRASAILEVPDKIEKVSINQLTEIADIYRKTQIQPKPRTYVEQNTKFDLREFIQKNGIEVKRESRYSDGTKFVLEHCIFDENHKAPDAAILLRDDGVICYNCFHDSCQDKSWKDVRLKFDPNAYEKQDFTRNIHPIPPRPKKVDSGVESQADAEREETKTFLKLSEIKSKDRSQIVSIPTGFTELDKKLIGMNKGEFSVWSGGNGSGKSTLLSQLCIEAVDRGFKVAMFSGELTSDRVKNWLLLQAAGRMNTRKSEYGENCYYVPKDISARISNWMEDKFWLYNNEKGFGVSDVMNAFIDHINTFDTDVIILDNLMSMDIAEASKEKIEAQSMVVLRMAELARQYNIHLHFVCHPKKTTGFLRKEDVSGSSDITNAADNVFMVHRVNRDFKVRAREILQNQTDAYSKYTNVIEIMKNRDLGRQDEFVGLYYEPESKRLLNDPSEIKVYGWENTQTEIELEMPW